MTDSINTVSSALQTQEQQHLRADVYQLLAALLRRTPTPELLAFLAELELEVDQDNAIIRAWHALKLSAENAAADQLEDEYFNLFIGLGHGEVIPYTSWYLTGSLMEQPLIQLRQDLQVLGLERDEQVKEPEDHLAALCEVMAYLLVEGTQLQQLQFFNRHLSPWVGNFFVDLAKADSASFYTSVAALGEAFFTLESAHFGALALDVHMISAD
ncbi:MAG: molecular chaperone TorD family protein [Ferrimonas sp.]